MSSDGLRVLQSLLFFPRGGSAQVAKYLTAELGNMGHAVRVVTGSVGRAGDYSHAATFYDGCDVTVAPYDTAAASDGDPMAAEMPFHPSYEDRGPDVPDRLFTAVSPALADWATARWEEFYRRTGVADGCDVLHVHHLTVQHHALRTIAPRLPIVAHLHGTELKMLEAATEALAGRPQSTSLPGAWDFSDYWTGRLARAAALADRLIVTSPADIDNAVRFLGVDESVVKCIANGVDTRLFRPRPVDLDALLRRWLVDEPRGWDTSSREGSVGYDAADLAAFAPGPDGGRPPLLVFVGRFTAVKRLNLLIESFAKALRAAGVRANLVVLGGFPGEWEGEHPVDVARRCGASNVFFAGWRGHAELAAFLPAADALLLPSINESFGQVLLEAMASEVPVLAVRRGGPPAFVQTSGDQRNGWLVEPDDADDLIAALVELLRSPEERRRRGDAGRRLVERSYSWATVAREFASLYHEVASRAATGTGSVHG